MRVLYITGSCLGCNTSANISHNSYLKGLIENGCKVDVIMADQGLLAMDEEMPVFDEANYYIYESLSKLDLIKDNIKRIVDKGTDLQKADKGISGNSFVGLPGHGNTFRFLVRTVLKYSYNFITNASHPHKYTRVWMKNAGRFQCDQEYDLVLSNSSPASSHALANTLLKKKRIKSKRWVQLWEDPWYSEISRKRIFKEEKRLLSLGQEIYYVTPLTLLYQKEYFPEDAGKMKLIPLPYFKAEKSIVRNIPKGKCIFGYFGDYFSHIRNLKPFYQAVKELNGYAYICGDDDESLPSTDRITVSKRVELGRLNKVQADTDVLIMLCNLQGGQIPGKIYHYSATDKPIVFILDGTAMDKKEIYNYFSNFNRYHFCENNKEDIKAALLKFMVGEEPKRSFCVEEFSPKNVIRRILDNIG